MKAELEAAKAPSGMIKTSETFKKVQNGGHGKRM
jgi:hypothetical protein